MDEKTMTENHPITPPPELVQQWVRCTDASINGELAQRVATQAARWGADQELEACCEWMKQGWDDVRADKLRATRRPKPPSLKEQALEALDQADKGLNESEWQQRSDTIRRALEQLPND